MEFLLVGAIVFGTGMWLGYKAYRFVRDALEPRDKDAPLCTDCPVCTQDMLACDGGEEAPCHELPGSELNEGAGQPVKK